MFSGETNIWNRNGREGQTHRVWSDPSGLLPDGFHANWIRVMLVRVRSNNNRSTGYRVIGYPKISFSTSQQLKLGKVFSSGSASCAYHLWSSRSNLILVAPSPLIGCRKRIRRPVTLGTLSSTLFSIYLCLFHSVYLFIPYSPLFLRLFCMILFGS